jgi:hypothetical protein
MVTTKELPVNDIVREVIGLLQVCPAVVLPVKGYSMLPFIIGWKESVELVKVDAPKVGDVVLAWVNGTHYVVHRIIRMDDDGLVLMGDGNLSGEEHCRLEDVAARADYVVDPDGRRSYLYTKNRVRASRLWWKLKPFRRIILAVYRRTLLRYQLRNQKI